MAGEPPRPLRPAAQYGQDLQQSHYISRSSVLLCDRLQQNYFRSEHLKMIFKTLISVPCVFRNSLSVAPDRGREFKFSLRSSFCLFSLQFHKNQAALSCPSFQFSVLQVGQGFLLAGQSEGSMNFNHKVQEPRKG